MKARTCKTISGGGSLLHRHRAPLARRSVVYFCSGALKWAVKKHSDHIHPLPCSALKGTLDAASNSKRQRTDRGVNFCRCYPVTAACRLEVTLKIEDRYKLGAALFMVLFSVAYLMILGRTAQ